MEVRLADQIKSRITAPARLGRVTIVESAPAPPQPTQGKFSWPLLGVVLAVVLGGGLRLIWVEDMEYKIDEEWTFKHTQQQSFHELFPWLGMVTSADFPNPGMSAWVFVVLGKIAGAHTPTELVRAVQVLNVLALVLLACFAYGVVPRKEREFWLWATALVALNPLAMLFQRKLWPPSVLPLFTLVILYCWQHRQRWGAAFCWGLIGACVGQIHMSGFFFAAGFVLWAVLFDRKSVAWRSWLVGSSLGAWPLIPWLHHLMTHCLDLPRKPGRWIHIFEMKYWLRWITDAFGLGLDYSLERDFGDFLAYPRLLGCPTYGVALLHLMLAAVALVLLVRAGRQLWRQRDGLWDHFLGRSSTTAFTQSAAFWGVGLLFTLSTFSIQRHYLIILFPLEFLWLARLTLDWPGIRAESLRFGRCMLLTLCLVQGLLSASFLGYVHVKQRIDGDFGVTYRAQCSARLP